MADLERLKTQYTSVALLDTQIADVMTTIKEARAQQVLLQIQLGSLRKLRTTAATAFLIAVGEETDVLVKAAPVEAVAVAEPVKDVSG